MRLNIETVKNWANVEYPKKENIDIVDICDEVLYELVKDMASDLLEAQELIKEMRSKLLIGGIQATEDMTMFRSIPVDVEIIRDLIKRTKEYAE